MSAEEDGPGEFGTAAVPCLGQSLAGRGRQFRPGADSALRVSRMTGPLACEYGSPHTPSGTFYGNGRRLCFAKSMNGPGTIPSTRVAKAQKATAPTRAGARKGAGVVWSESLRYMKTTIRK